MAGSQIYIGDMLDSLHAKMDSVMSKMDDQISMLSTVNASVAQNLNRLIVESGSSNVFSIYSDAGGIEAIGNGSDGAAKTKIKTIKFLCDGSITVDAWLYNPDTTIQFGGIWMKRNSDAWTKIITSAAAGSGGRYSSNITVGYGDVIEFDVGGYANAKSIKCTELRILYNIKNVVTGGAFASV